jgi:hypothetical protein
MDAGFVVAALGSAAGVLGTGVAGGQIGTSGRPVRLANWFHFDSLRPLAKPVWLSVWRRGCLRLLCGAAIGVLCIGCEQQGTASGIASFKPVFLPVTFVISSDGSISAEGDLSYVTPLGEFSIGAQYSLQQVDNSILVILRDRNRIPSGLDTIYRVRTAGDEFDAVLDGRTEIHIADGQVTVDITNATVSKIQFKQVKNLSLSTVHGFWDSSYHPFLMSQWIVRQRSGIWYAAGIFIVPADIIIVPFMAAVQLSKRGGPVAHYVTIILLVLLVFGLVFGGSADYSEYGSRAAGLGLWAVEGFLCFWIMSGVFMR